MRTSMFLSASLLAAVLCGCNGAPFGYWGRHPLADDGEEIEAEKPIDSFPRASSNSSTRSPGTATRESRSAGVRKPAAKQRQTPSDTIPDAAEIGLTPADER